MKPEFYRLSKEEQKEFMRRDRERMDELGYKLHFMIDCGGPNSDWQFIGIEVWPRMEAIKEIERFHEEELKAYKYSEYKAFHGTPVFDGYAQSGITNK